MTQFLAAPSYIYPTSGNADWARLVAAAAEVKIVLINPGSGPGSSSNSDYVAQVSACHTAGQKVIGYIHSSYTGATLASMESQIDDYYTWYGVDGIFIDEVTNTVGAGNVNLTYYSSLYTYIKGKSAGATVIINPGTACDEPYMTVCDIVCNCESDLGFYRTRSAAAWESGYAASRFWHIIYACGWADQADGGIAQMYEALNLSRSYGAGYVWITPDVETNPYDTAPSGTYWTDLTGQIASPTTLTGPFPVLEDGFDHDGLVINTAAWTVTGSPAVSSSYQLTVTGHNSYADHLDSAATFDFTAAGAASVRAATMPSSSSGEAFMQVVKDGSNLLCIGKSGGNLLCRYKTAGTSSDTTVTWNATSMAYWQLTYASGTVTWQTSPDRATWTTQRTVSSGLPALTSVTLQFLCGHYVSGDPDETAALDNVLVAATASPPPPPAAAAEDSMGYAAQTGDPFTGFVTRSTASLAIYQVSGAICLSRIDAPAGTLNGYLSFDWSKPSGGSPANSYVGLYNAAGTRLWVSSDLTATASGPQRISMSLSSLAAGPFYVASLVGTQGTTAGGLAMFAGGLTLGTGTVQRGTTPWRCSSLTGSATALPSSLTYASFARNYYLVWAAID